MKKTITNATKAFRLDDLRRVPGNVLAQVTGGEITKYYGGSSGSTGGTSGGTSGGIVYAK